MHLRVIAALSHQRFVTIVFCDTPLVKHENPLYEARNSQPALATSVSDPARRMMALYSSLISLAEQKFHGHLLHKVHHYALHAQIVGIVHAKIQKVRIDARRQPAESQQASIENGIGEHVGIVAASRRQI